MAETNLPIESGAQSSAKTTRAKKRSAAVAATGRASLAGLQVLVTIGLIVGVIATGALIGGFVDFSQRVAAPSTLETTATADGIVVLTGAPLRIEKGLELLADGRAKRLLISGVGAKTSDAEVRRRNPAGAQLFSCCVDTERAAANTVGNATESAKWVRGKNYKSIILVTSDYHMPRSLLEFRKSLPDVTIQPHSVAKISAMGSDWWMEAGPLRLMLNEYMKFLGAGLRKYF